MYKKSGAWHFADLYFFIRFIIWIILRAFCPSSGDKFCNRTSSIISRSDSLNDTPCFCAELETDIKAAIISLAFPPACLADIAFKKASFSGDMPFVFCALNTSSKFMIRPPFLCYSHSIWRIYVQCARLSPALFRKTSSHRWKTSKTYLPSGRFVPVRGHCRISGYH